MNLIVLLPFGDFPSSPATSGMARPRYWEFIPFELQKYFSLNRKKMPQMSLAPHPSGYLAHIIFLCRTVACRVAMPATSQSSIGPYATLEQSPAGDSSRHALTAPLSLVLDDGENAAGRGQSGKTEL